MKKSSQIFKKFYLLLIFLALLIILNLTGYSRNIKNFFFLISSPVQETFWQAGKNISIFFSRFSDQSIFQKKIEMLESENHELFSRIIFLKELKKENEFLKEALDIGLENDFELMLARVVGKDVFYDSILINKGKKDRVLSGLPVVTSQKVLLGRIGQVYDDFSEVILISNKKSSFDVKIIGDSSEPDGVYGILKGKENFKADIDLIPKDEEIFENDIIVTSILGGIYPAGLLVGEVKAVENLDVEPFQQAEAGLLFDIRKLDYIFIIIGF